MFRLSLLFCSLSILASSAYSAVLLDTVVYTEAAQIDADNSVDTQDVGDDINAGRFNNDTNIWSANVTFELPDLGGAAFDSADINFYFRETNNAPAVATTALYVQLMDSTTNGVIDGSDRIAPADFTTGNPPAGWTEITLNFVDADTTKGQVISLDSGAQTNLNSFLSSNYDAGKYLQFALAYDGNGNPPDGFSERFTFNTSQDGKDETTNPISLDVYVIPEPSAGALLLGIGGVFFLIRRRR